MRSTGRYAAAATAAALLLMVVSCSEDSPYRPGRSPVSTTVTVSPSVVSAGEAFEIDVKIEVQGRDVDVPPGCEALLGYRIETEDGTVVAEYPGPDCVPSSGAVHLTIGETRTAQLDVTTLLFPGTYRVLAGLTNLDDTYPWTGTPLTVAPSAEAFAISGTISIDSYDADPPEYDCVTQALAGKSTRFLVMCDSVGPIGKSDFVIADQVRIRSSTRLGYGSHWAFANPLFAAVWGDLLESRSFSFSSYNAVVLSTGAETRLTTFHVALPGVDLEIFDTWQAQGDQDLPVNADGIPIFDRDVPLVGQITSGHAVIDLDAQYFERASVRGTMDATALNVGLESPYP